ncbi:MAG: phage integrase N-terminal SAM-like domain-containing protein [Pseudomonadota bacterium]
MSDKSTPCELAARGAPRPLDRVVARIRERYYGRRTGEACAYWIRQFILFHDRRHPREMGDAEVMAFLDHFATERDVSPGTQNPALWAILFLYKEVLGRSRFCWRLVSGMHSVWPARCARPEHGSGVRQAARAASGSKGVITVCFPLRLARMSAAYLSFNTARSPKA